MPTLPSKEYWEERAVRSLLESEKTAAQHIDSLALAYDRAILNITREIESFYSKYASNNKITLAEARKRLTPVEVISFNKQAKVYLDEITRLGSSAFTKEYRSYLRALSGRAYVSRLQELTVNIRHQIELLSTSKENDLRDVLTGTYDNIYSKSLYDIQSKVEIGVMFTLPNTRALEAIVNEKWLGSNYSERIWQDKNSMLGQLEQVLSQEFVRGRGPNVVSRDLANKLNVSYSNAKRLVRTELNYISNKAMMQSYVDSEVLDKYQYLATLDNRTSEICIELDSKIFPLKEATVGVNYPPMHPNCRSTTIPYFEDDEISKNIVDRIERNAEGKSVRLGRDTKLSYKEWKELSTK